MQGDGENDGGLAAWVREAQSSGPPGRRFFAWDLRGRPRYDLDAAKIVAAVRTVDPSLFSKARETNVLFAGPPSAVLIVQLAGDGRYLMRHVDHRRTERVAIADDATQSSKQQAIEIYGLGEVSLPSAVFIDRVIAGAVGERFVADGGLEVCVEWGSLPKPLTTQR